ncbi:MAG: endonuclease/exonuclease/phosphatase family protein [Planktomarina sp.]
MQVMCLNGWGGKEHAALIPFLTNAAPDVLCLQDVVHTKNAPKDWLEYRDGRHILPQRARFFDDVRRALPNHIATFCPAAQGFLWDGDTAVPSQWGLATFALRSLTMVGQIQGFVHKQFGSDGYGDHPRSRTAHGIRLWDFKRDQGMTITHMHGLCDPMGKGDSQDRLVQAKRFAGMIGAVSEPGDAVIACGDFNVLPGRQTFDILGGMGLKDLVTGRGHDGTRNALYGKSEKFADYFMVNDLLEDCAFDVIRDPLVSDHCPLVLTL